MSLSVSIAILLQAIAPQAASEPAPVKPDIVVEARNEAVIRDFVKRLADPMPTHQLPRWDRQICTGVIGLDAAQAQMMNDRIAQIANSVHLRSGKPGCAPTILIVVSPQADAVAKRVADKYPITLRREGSARLDRFRQPKQPVRWIGTTYEGAATNASSALNGYFKDGALPSAASSGFTGSATRINEITRGIVSSMLVIVDPAQIGSVKLDALSDYVAMVALARPGLGRPAPTTSILSLFADATVAPRSITRFDQDYLSGLYTTSPNHDASWQASSIARSMKTTKKQDGPK
ncbi:hypothetical protein C8J47_0388 [Sphingomonas sp. PP-F2F-G114-C0414]|nr:hypothetical protein C8J47_0388 [Sphingomonas sp. PP-F2F-G114-C0414]